MQGSLQEASVGGEFFWDLIIISDFQNKESVKR